MITTLDTKGANFIQKEEGCILHSYQDKGGVWTIGYGNTYYIDGTKVKKGDVITQAEATTLFWRLVPIYTASVLRVSKQLTQNQFDACTSLCWNIGNQGFINSSLAKQIQTNPNDATTISVNQIAEEDIVVSLKKMSDVGESIHKTTYNFLKWREVDGEFNQDLFDRRWREAKLYLGQS